MTTSHSKPTKDEALKLALEALQDLIGEHYGEKQTVVSNLGRRAVFAIREALAQPAADDKAGGEVALENSQEANDAIQAVLKEYGYPSNPANAARAGWRACRLYTRPQPQADSNNSKPKRSEL